MIFHKALAKYYHKWFFDCHESAIYCRERGNEQKAKEYLDDAKVYLSIIMDNWDAIEFFSNDDKAFLIESLLPKEFRDLN